MIIKGKSRGDAVQLAGYLISAEKNERVDVLQVRGTTSENLMEALAEMEGAAAGTRCELPLYHAQLRTAPGEHLTAEQWERSADVLTEQLGMEDHARAIVLHTKDGQQHAHVVFGRIDPETMLAADDGHNYLAHEATARQLEREFGLRRVQGVHAERNYDELRPDRTPDEAEMQQGDRLKVDVREFRQELRELRTQCDSGTAFVAALAERGVTLCQGDRRAFVLLDEAGGVHSAARTLGMKVAELGEYFAAVQRDTLPTVDEARAQLPERSRAAEAAEPEPERPEIHARRIEREAEKQEIAGRISTAWREADGDAVLFAVNLGEAGLTLAVNDRGRAVAVDAKGWTHGLTEQALDDDPRAAQQTIAAAFDGAELSLPAAAEVKAERDAERLAAWKAERADERRAAYVERQRDRLEDNKTAQAIDAAWEAAPDAVGFVAGLEARGLTVAAVSPEEAQASVAARMEAQAHKAERIPRELHTGDLYAVNRYGDAYAIDATTVRGADDRTIFARLGELADEPPCLAEARIAQFAAREIERRAFYVAKGRERLAFDPTVDAINQVWRDVTDMAEFVPAMEERGIVLGRVSAMEEFENRAARAQAEQRGEHLPRELHWGDLYAVNASGRAFILDGSTIRGDDEPTIAARLAALDPHGQLSLEGAKAEQQHRREDARIEAARERLAGNPTVQQIGQAWAFSDDGASFAQALEDRGIVLVRVSAEEALASQQRQEAMVSHGKWAPAYEEGQYLAVDRRGHAFALDATTIYDAPERIAARLGQIDGDSQLSLSQGREVMAWLNPRDAEPAPGYAPEFTPGVAASVVMGSIARFGDHMFAALGDVLDYFLGGTSAPQHQAAPLWTPPPSYREREPTRADHGRDQLHRAAPETAASDPQLQSFVASQNADADVLALIRRQIEERDRERGRD